MNEHVTTLMTHARGAWHTLWSALRLFADDQGLSWAGAIGLYLFLSVPPFLIATAWVAGLFFPPEQGEAFMLEQVAKYLPAEQDLLEGILANKPTEALGGVISVALLLFSGSRAFAALTSAVNVMWRRVDQLTFVRRQALRLGMLLVTLVLLGLAALGEAAVAALFSGGSSADELWLLDWQLIPSLLLGAFLLIAYRLLPREPVSWTHAALGAVVAGVAVRLAQAAFGALSNAGTFRTPYGELAGVALMATWALVVGVIILFGAALVAVLEGKRTEEGKDADRFSRASG
ncbi:MAG: YihY/virulence factor BrkB family protein [Chloroflexi bacterium]|nr:YihY/virulence factor BrkB family protein [Chloroflexota bacterium]